MNARLTDDETALVRSLFVDARNGTGETVDEAFDILCRAERLLTFGFVEVVPVDEVAHPNDDRERNAIRLTPAGYAFLIAVSTRAS